MSPILLFFYLSSSSYVYCLSVSNSTTLHSILNVTALANSSISSNITKSPLIVPKNNDTKLAEVKPNITILKALPTDFLEMPYFGKQNVIGDPCNKTIDCKIHKAICIGGTCQCNPEDTPSITKRNCLTKAKEILDDCIEKVQCEVGLNATGLVACVGFRCICNHDSILIDNKCYKRLALGEKCTKNEECRVYDSSCIQNVCACNEDAEPDETDSICVPMNASVPALLNCTNDQVCNVLFGDAYHCTKGACVCKPGYLSHNLTCIKERRLDEACDADIDCYVDLWPNEKSDLRQCKNNTCTCIPKFKADIKNNLCKSGASIFSSCNAIILLLLIYLNFLRTEQ